MTKFKDKPLKKTIQVRVDKEDIEAIEICKKYYGHKTDASLVRFAMLRMAEAIKEKPLSISLQK